MNSRLPVPFDPIAWRWATPLAVPPLVDLRAGGAATLTVKAYRHQLAAAVGGLPALTVERWGYAAKVGKQRHPPTSPGPTILATSDTAVNVTWANALPWRKGANGEHKPPAYPFVMAKDPVAAMMMMPRYATGHTVVHLHGGHVPWASDGYPMRLPKTDTCLHANPTGFTAITPPGGSLAVDYPNTQPAATLWYHDHLMDSTATNVYAGLAGAYVLCHPDEGKAQTKALQTPGTPLVLQDISLVSTPATGNVHLYYGQIDKLDGYLAQRAEAGSTRAALTGWIAANPPAPEFKGSAMMVNATLWPTHDVPRGPVRFRMVNGCSGRLLAMRLSRQAPPAADHAEWQMAGDTAGEPSNARMWQIGSDGGFLPKAVSIAGKPFDRRHHNAVQFLILAPGERADVVIDFSQCQPGEFVFLTNHATESAPLGNGGDDANATWPSSVKTTDPTIVGNISATTTTARLMGLDQIMRFRIGTASAETLDPDVLDRDLAHLTSVPPKRPNPGTPGDTMADRALVIREFDSYVTTKEIAAVPHVSRPPWNGISFRDRTTPPNAPGKIDLSPGNVWSKPLIDTGSPGNAVLTPPGGGPLVIAGKDERRLRQGKLDPAKADDLTEWEIWELWNISNDVHPIHLHHTQFLVLDRWTIDDQLVLAPGSRRLPDPNEMGWKDTVRSAQLELVRLAVRFDDGGDPTRDYAGNFVLHCHLLDHEDMGMMRPLRIGKELCDGL